MKKVAPLIVLASVAVLASCAQAPPPSVPPVQPTPGRSEAMAKLGFMRGVWAGSATGTHRDGTRYSVTQTERIGPMLGGDIIVIEGRGYKDDDSTGFNAFGVVSWDLRTGKYEMRSYAQGYAGTFELKLAADGCEWEVPAGPGAVMRFTVTVKDGQWREVGEYIAAGKPPVQTFEMNLKRVGDTDWPLGAPVPPSVGRQ